MHTSIFRPLIIVTFLLCFVLPARAATNETAAAPAGTEVANSTNQTTANIDALHQNATGALEEGRSQEVAETDGTQDTVATDKADLPQKTEEPEESVAADEETAGEEEPAAAMTEAEQETADQRKAMDMEEGIEPLEEKSELEAAFEQLHQSLLLVARELDAARAQQKQDLADEIERRLDERMASVSVLSDRITTLRNEIYTALFTGYVVIGGALVLMLIITMARTRKKKE